MSELINRLRYRRKFKARALEVHPNKLLAKPPKKKYPVFIEKILKRRQSIY